MAAEIYIIGILHKWTPTLKYGGGNMIIADDILIVTGVAGFGALIGLIYRDLRKRVDNAVMKEDCEKEMKVGRQDFKEIKKELIAMGKKVAFMAGQMGFEEEKNEDNNN
jgi:hypothetical protein